MPREPGKRQLNVTVPSPFIQHLAMAAALTGKTRGDIVTEALRAWFKIHAKRVLDLVK